ncbi:MAG: DUF559 domain-containing protein [Arthrobacter sp.]|nr:DUF559 domain-containing protein [Arthrobacter sp.]MDZ4353414.1 DUF559 domain-containing protein [Arthrobacter sp.]
MDVFRALAICGGAARRPALSRLGIDDAALRRAVRAGVLQPVRGLYALPTAAPDFYADGVGYVDLLLEGRLIVELDGRQHGEWPQIKKDQRRNNVSVARGYTVLRYYYDDVVHHPEPKV